MAEFSSTWNAWGWKGWMASFMMVVLISFPPLTGFNICSIFIGMVYGLKGWPLLASATVVGSACAFAPFKYVLRKRAIQLMNYSENLKLFMDVFNDEDSSYWENLLVLVLLRMSPLPYSLSNGAIAAIPGISVSNFALATAITTPKLLLQLLVGIQLKGLNDNKTTGLSKVLNFLGVILASGSFTAVTFIIFSKMKARIQKKNRIPDDSLDALVFESDSAVRMEL
ncbi:hypothetical protein FOA43_003752 [Brettanomyces nanus]|uniref:Golgi apparatus membrane protein TVP38 n=1 Tax=Eeniella nana TaxID=13502 RepID=A0A875SBZ2_EENNA|nr:uncharacterized protein FOA43_003752 [Brettanomyces nanus]QPG76364.1 hypothetical protein FOA43_003752 [Brettanomyces nanus]